MPRKPSRLLAQLMPKRLYMALANTEGTSHEIVASQYTGDIVGVGVTKIWQYRVEERESCNTEECGSDNSELR